MKKSKYKFWYIKLFITVKLELLINNLIVQIKRTVPVKIFQPQVMWVRESRRRASCSLWLWTLVGCSVGEDWQNQGEISCFTESTVEPCYSIGTVQSNTDDQNLKKLCKCSFQLMSVTAVWFDRTFRSLKKEFNAYVYRYSTYPFIYLYVSL
jgi:hypothetical protein